MNSIISNISAIVGGENVLFDDKSRLLYSRDLTQNLNITSYALCVVFPENTEILAQLVKYANLKKIHLVPSGGRTGYSGGAIAQKDEIVISFEKMNRIKDVNIIDKNMTCEAGVTLKNIQETATKHHLFYPVDFASSETCQIGGNISTNAGGIQVLRYGSTRNWISGLKVVTGKGDILTLNNGLHKNSSGYDFRHLFIGSEGTLGFITETILNLTHPPKKTSVVLISAKNIKTLMEILSKLREAVSIIAFEVFSDEALESVLDDSNLLSPFSNKSKFYALAEYEIFNQEQASKAYTFLKSIHTDEILIANSSDEAKYYWKFRKNISASLQKHFPQKYDIAVIPSKIPKFVLSIEKFLNSLEKNIKIIWFGHAGDGNLHLNILKPSDFTQTEFFNLCEKINDDLYTIVKEFQGTVSAEHGIGLLKKKFLGYTRSSQEILLMREIKKVFDPNNIMNPGKLI